MNPITDSVIKEGFRKANDDAAHIKERTIQQKADADIAKLKREHVNSVGCLGVIIFPILIYTHFHNKSIDEQINKIKNDTAVQITNIYIEADRMTMQQIKRYEAEVDEYHKKVLKNADTIKAMVDHMTMMFQRMISHADASAHKRFIETNFIYTVRKTGISFNYQSAYTNPKDDYNFEKERYRDLRTDSECEGLAQALAKLTIREMKSKYPPNSLSINVSHNDATVTMKFKAANKNFIPARDIV